MLFIDMNYYAASLNGNFYEKAQKNLRRFKEFYSNPRNVGPRKAPSIFSYSKIMDFSGEITSSKNWQNGFYSEGGTGKN